MDGREQINCHSVRSRHREFGVSVLKQSTSKKARVDIEIGVTSTALDGDFP